MINLNETGARAKSASHVLAAATSQTKNDALKNIGNALISNMKAIIEANKKDIENGKAAGLSDALLDRLMLNEARIRSMAQGVDELISMDDPVGKVVSGTTRPNGLKIQNVRVPLGVIAVIFEARPNVTSDAATLCLKAGNAVILRGGKEAINSNLVISLIMREAVQKAGLPADCIQLISDTSRESANALMRMNEYIDVLIPRGGAGLISAVVQNSTVPVIETGTGNCHVYIDKYADVDMAANIVFNAKTTRVSVCNSCESLLVHADIAQKALPVIAQRLNEKNVEIRGCERTRAILPDAVAASEDDWGQEYLDYIISCKVVDSINEAVEHIGKYSTGHSEAIVTDNYFSSEFFTSRVDSAAVYVNASTRYTDGSEFGYGAEIGISTQKLHARGPLGLNNLTTDKYVIFGNGQIR